MKLFGTDGIRGKANTPPMDPFTIMRVGAALGQYLVKREKKPRVVIGKDTRLSGYMLETALTSGLVSAGANVLLVGPMPTPAVSHLTRSLNASVGVMISASHNPAEDNGIKIFDSEGHKLSLKEEQAIEKLAAQCEKNHGGNNGIGKAYRLEDARGRYVEFVKSSINNHSLDGLKVVVDCANGAGYAIAPKVFRELGAEVTVLSNKPDGKNINENCGALHPKHMAQEVRKNKADFGFALDGDADRVIVCDEKGETVDGDHLLALFAKDSKQRKRLPDDLVVGTVLCNAGLEAHLQKQGMKFLRADVGDKYVEELMRKKGAALGGEPSGHLIFGKYATTGDGILAALQLARLLKNAKKPLSKLAPAYTPFAHIEENISITQKPPLEKNKGVQEAIKQVEETAGENGRVLVRYSGTEPLLRLMVEGKEEKTVKETALKLKKALEKEVKA